MVDYFSRHWFVSHTKVCEEIIMALSFRGKQILLYEGGYINSDFIDTANTADINNLREDFLEAAKTMDKEIEAGNFITVDKQFVMNNVGMFRGIHDAGAPALKSRNYVFNFEFEDAQSFDETHNVSLVFDPTMPASHITSNIGVGLEPLISFEQQFYDEWQFVPSLEDWGYHILNWTPAQLIQLIEKV